MKKTISIIICVIMIVAVSVTALAATEDDLLTVGATGGETQVGDINGDGERNNKDVVLLFRYVSAGSPDGAAALYDYNGDGNVDNKDVVSLFRAVSGGSSGGTTPAKTEYKGYVSKLQNGEYSRAEDEDIYNGALAKFERMRQAASNETDPDKRFVLYAQAEAELLDSAVMIPTKSNGGDACCVSRIAPRTLPFTSWGGDASRLKGMVVSAEFLTPAERNELIDQWKTAKAGSGTYDPAAYLKSKGHTLKTEYSTFYYQGPATLDWLNTSRSTDSEYLVNVVDGLAEYDNFGVLQPALAESWEISDDMHTYTFHIRKGVSWYTSDGEKYAELTAHDFEAGFRHMLDAGSGLEWTVSGVIEGVYDYLGSGGSWENVGYKAADDYTLVVTLEYPAPYFLTMLSYSCFLPMCKTFYESKGGVFGIDEYAAVCGDPEKYTFGSVNDISSQVYCGAFIPEKLAADSEIIFKKNPNYYKPGSVKLDKLRWVYTGDYSDKQLYDNIVSGEFEGARMSVSGNAVYDYAEADGIIEKYGFIAESGSATYITTLNLNRGTFELEGGNMASPKAEQEKADTATAMNNKSFRQALAYAFDRVAWNSEYMGERFAKSSLRNIFTMPSLVQLSADTTDGEGHTFKAKTSYGELVQYYLEKLGSPIKVEDGQDGWYNADNAKAAFKKAKKELGDSVSWPIRIDLPFSPDVKNSVAWAESFKKSVESVLGKENVTFNLIEGDRNGYLDSVYYTVYGNECNYDISYMQGWGPDYGDPSTYINTFAPDYMGFLTSSIGLF